MAEEVIKRFKTIVLHCDSYTLNHRLYHKSEISESLENNKVLKEKLENHALFGGLGAFNTNTNEIDEFNIAFSVENLYWNNHNLEAEIAILNTLNGYRLLESIEEEGNVGFTIAGIGDVGQWDTVENYELITIYAGPSKFKGEFISYAGETYYYFPKVIEQIQNRYHGSRYGQVDKSLLNEVVRDMREYFPKIVEENESDKNFLAKFRKIMEGAEIKDEND